MTLLVAMDSRNFDVRPVIGGVTAAVPALPPAGTAAIVEIIRIYRSRLRRCLV
jgi:hypothetical protein